MPARSYKAAFCEQSGCPPDRFPDEVFRRCLYPHAVPLACLMGRLSARLFDEDRKAIEQFGLSSSFGEVRAVVEDLRYVNHTNKSWLRTTLKIRLSGRRLVMLAERLSEPSDEHQTARAKHGLTNVPPNRPVQDIRHA